MKSIGMPTSWEAGVLLQNVDCGEFPDVKKDDADEEPVGATRRIARTNHRNTTSFFVSESFPDCKRYKYIPLANPFASNVVS